MMSSDEKEEENTKSRKKLSHKVERKKQRKLDRAKRQEEKRGNKGEDAEIRQGVEEVEEEQLPDPQRKGRRLRYSLY